jgi:hypothetical protein
MSKTLRRPMFRGGKIDSRGSGITSGLDKPKRGLVDEPGGYAGVSMSGLKNYADIFGGSGSSGSSGSGIVNAAKNKIYSRPIGPPAPGFFDKLRAVPYLGRAVPFLTGTAGTMGAGAGAGIGIGQLVDFYAKSTSTPEEYKRRKEMSSIPFMFDETNLDVGEAFKYIDEGSKIGEKPGFFPRGGKKKFFEDKGLDPETGLPKEVDDFEVSGEAVKVNPGETTVDALFAAGEAKAANRKKAENILSDDTILNNQNTANEELTLEEIRDTLGYKKARGRDLGDMFGRAAAAFIGAPSVSEGAAKFFDAESRSGPGRAEKIETAAATFMLKDKAQTKRDKANIELMKSKIDYQIKAGENINLPKALLAANKSGLLNNKELAVGIQGATSPTTGKNYKFKGVVTRDEFSGKLADAEVGDTFVVTAKVKGGDGIEKIVKRIVEIQLDDRGQKTPVGIYNI